MFANNEIGTIQPIKEIGAIAKKHNILFPYRCSTGFGQLNINVEDLGIDMMSASAHKLNGPKELVSIYKKVLKIRSFIHGGAQERGRR